MAAVSASDTNSEINRKYEELRSIGSELAVLTGREPKFGRKREKETENGSEESAAKSLSMSRRITMDSDTSKDAKRPRLIYDIPARRNTDEKGDFSPIRKPTVQSSVRMATIETKSRDQTIADQKKQQKLEDGKRNRRMFGNLLGTLKQFQKEELKPALKQAEKLKEVEERLEKTSREEKEKFLNDKRTYEQKMREKEDEIKRLKQKRAIQIKGEIKIGHYKRLQKYIQTEAKPAIFFLPASHTLRSMELLKKSTTNMDGLIKKREEQMETELRELDELSDGEIAPTVRSSIKVASSIVSSSRFKSIEDNGELDDDFDDSDEDDRIRVRSSVVIKGEKVEETKENKVSEEKQENETSREEIETKNDEKEES